MGDTIKPGGLGDSDDPPIPAAFANSMAAAMETALNALLDQLDRDRVPVDNTAESRDRRAMFLAIAQGLVNHLVANQDAFKIKDLANNELPVKVVIQTE